MAASLRSGCGLTRKNGSGGPSSLFGLDVEGQGVVSHAYWACADPAMIGMNEKGRQPAPLTLLRRFGWDE